MLVFVPCVGEHHCAVLLPGFGGDGAACYACVLRYGQTGECDPWKLAAGGRGGAAHRCSLGRLRATVLGTV